MNRKIKASNEKAGVEVHSSTESEHIEVVPDEGSFIEIIWSYRYEKPIGIIRPGSGSIDDVSMEDIALCAIVFG